MYKKVCGHLGVTYPDTGEKMKKITVIGAGFVGSSITYSLMLIEAADEIALVDINETAVRAEVADIRPGLSCISPSRVYQGTWADTADSDIIIMTAGVSRRPEESRLDLIGRNAAIARNVARQIKENNSKAVVIVVSNPVDIVTRIMAEELSETSGRVFGTGCLLDSARFASVLADFLNISEKSVRAFVAGEHGAGQVLLWSSVQIDGHPLTDWLAVHDKSLSSEDKNRIAKDIADMGAHIIAGKGRTHYGIAGCTAYIVNEMKCGHEVVLPLTRPLAGEFGFSGVCASLPRVLTKDGASAGRTDTLTSSEIEQIRQYLCSAAALKV